MLEKDSSRSEPPTVHYLGRSEFIQLLVSRRRLARLWLRRTPLVAKNLEALLDLKSGDVYVAREALRSATLSG